MVAVIVAAHGRLAEGLIASSAMIAGPQEDLVAVTFDPSEGPDDLLAKYTAAVEKSPSDRYLILVDLLGGSPYNAAARFAGDIARYRAGGGSDPYKQLRSNLGRSILLGLELLVAGDIINTVAVEPTLASLAVLAGIVLIRTFLSVSLEVEIEGRWPWQSASEPARDP